MYKYFECCFLKPIKLKTVIKNQLKVDNVAPSLTCGQQASNHHSLLIGLEKETMYNMKELIQCLFPHYSKLLLKFHNLFSFHQ